MNNIEKSIYKIISKSRNKTTLSVFNFFTHSKDYTCIMPNLYLGNVNSSSNINFLQNNNIEAIINCTNDIEFNDYFKDKGKFRISIEDNKEVQNMKKFENDIYDAIKFIDLYINSGKAVLVHCYYGLMRSATVIACYLVLKYKMSFEDAIIILQKKNSFTFNSQYNFEEIVKHVYDRFHQYF